MFTKQGKAVMQMQMQMSSAYNKFILLNGLSDKAK